MQCQFIKDDQKQCGAQAIKETMYCFSHNPDTQEEKHIAVVRGGTNSRTPRLGLPTIELNNPQQVVHLLADTINQVRSGEIPPNIANTVGYLASHLLKAIEVSNLDQRVEMIESALGERKLATRSRR